MSMMTRSRRYLDDAARAFDRAPVEVATAVVLAIAFSFAVEGEGDAFRAFTELAVAGALIIAAAWTGTLLHGLGAWPARLRWITTAVAAIVVAGYALLVLDFELAAEGWRAFMLVSAAVLWVAGVPAFAAHSGVPDAGAIRSGATPASPTPTGSRTDDDVALTRAVDGRFLLRVIGALLYAGALFAGLSLALGAVNTLFELDMNSEIYGHVFGWIFLGLAPWIVAGGVPDYVRPIEADATAGGAGVAGVARRMMAFLIPPLLALYCLILYAYAIRIGVTGEVPKNLLSPMVLAAGALTALALFLFDDDVDRGMLRWLRYAPPLFLPLALLGAWALWQRVDQYGWTEFRLLRLIVLLTFAALAVLGTVLLFRRRRYPLHLVPLILAGVLVLSAVGPWSVTAVSRRSQYDRLVKHLDAVGINATNADEATSPRSIPAGAWEEINSTGRYIATHFGVDELPPVLASRASHDGAVYDLAATLGLEPEWPDTVHAPGIVAQLADNATVSVGGITVQRIRLMPERMPGSMSAAAGTLIVRQDSTLLSFNAAGEELQVSITSLMDSAGSMRMPRLAGGPMVVPPEPPSGALTGEQAWLEVRAADGTRRGDLLVLHLAVHTEDGVLRLRDLDGLLFFGGPN